MLEKQVKYRKDYQSSAYLIQTVMLEVQLGEEKTLVKNTMQIIKNEHGPKVDLFLNGKEQVLLSIKLNGNLLDEKSYQVNDEGITISHVPASFELEIVSEIQPQLNTSLMGLYRTNGTFCTQCEAEGFRKITYYIDRPDVMAIFTTKIIGDKEKYPVLLANGNLIESGDLPNGQHFAVWHDPFKKPCYLFAMVAGNLAYIEDHFITMSKRRITLKIFAAEQVIDKCHFAMQSLKKAMKWDEEKYGREYDLDIFMIVAVNDFNFGAMENKGLNIFNDKFILANPRTATDEDYEGIDIVVGHEYFHNWSGNRVTLRDWFQLSLKEGFTVFRDQTFNEDLGMGEVKRIERVKLLRSRQFPEDAGPLAHPVRPDSYIEMGNFYTATVYEKGAEIIRMLHTILGEQTFRKATDLYFAKNDGKAVTCDDFVSAMEEASHLDLTQFKLWYSQAGTPAVNVKGCYDETKKEYHLIVDQHCPATPGQTEKKDMFIPLSVALYDKDGNEMPLFVEEIAKDEKVAVLPLRAKQQTFIFSNISHAPIPSLLRDFSSPVYLNYPYSEAELQFLMRHDQDAFARWEAGQQYLLKLFKQLLAAYHSGIALVLPESYIKTLLQIISDSSVPLALRAEMLSVPEETYLAEVLGEKNPEALVMVKTFYCSTLALELQAHFQQAYLENSCEESYGYNEGQVAKRRFKNAVLNYLMWLKTEEVDQLAFKQFKDANNMSDQYAALASMLRHSSPQHQAALEQFYQTYQHDALVLDKWFVAQAMANRPDIISKIKELLNHPAFNEKNPNKVRSLIGGFTKNFAHFHEASGVGYQFIADYIIHIDQINPMVASRLVAALANWRMFADPWRTLMHNELQRIMAVPNLSPDVFEIVTKSV